MKKQDKNDRAPGGKAVRWKRGIACVLALSLLSSTAWALEPAFAPEVSSSSSQTISDAEESASSDAESASSLAPESESALPAGTEESSSAPESTDTSSSVPPDSASSGESASSQAVTPVPESTETIAASASETDSEIPLDTTSFPDQAFLDRVRAFDTDGNGALSPSECAAVTRLDVRNKGIRSLEGIGCFPNLTYLNCIGNALSELPLEQLPHLTSLLCNENDLSALDLACVPELELLHCHDNRLAALDVSMLPRLQELACGDNLFETLDVSQNANLTYLLYLGGPLKTLTLSNNTALSQLWCSYSLVSQLDLSQAPNLELLGIDRSEFQFLDLSANTKLTDVLGADNQLLAVRTGGARPRMELSNQRPVDVQIAEGESTFDLTRLSVPIDPACISDVTGAQLTGSVLSGIQDNSMVTYRYTDGTASFTATLQFHVSNAWLEPLTLEDWTYGTPHHDPHANAQYGQPVYEYSASPDGTFTARIPENAGTWYVRASVAPSPEHASLTAVTEFHILKAPAVYTLPANLTAVYGSTLDSVDPGTGFTWKTADQTVGNVGTHTFEARYVPADLANYLVADPVSIPLRVTPKHASQLWVSDVKNEEDARHLTVRDGDKTLQEGVDYTLAYRTINNQMMITISFTGNYTGSVFRGYPISQPSPNVPVTPVQPEKTPHPQTARPIVSVSTSSSRPASESTPPVSQSDPDAGSSSTAVSDPESTAPSSASSESTADPAPSQSHPLCWLALLLLILLGIALAFYLMRSKDDPDPPQDTQ